MKEDTKKKDSKSQADLPPKRIVDSMMKQLEQIQTQHDAIMNYYRACSAAFAKSNEMLESFGNTEMFRFPIPPPIPHVMMDQIVGNLPVWSGHHKAIIQNIRACNKAGQKFEAAIKKAGPPARKAK